MAKKAESPSLNIKDPEAHRLAEEIARQTGQSITQTVIEALRDRRQNLARDDAGAMAADLRSIARRAAAHVRRPYLDHAQFLYDDRGLPK